MNHEVMALLLGDGDEVTGCIFPFLFPFTNEILTCNNFVPFLAIYLNHAKRNELMK